MVTIVLKNYYDGTISVPRNLVYESEFKQGNNIFLHVGNTYFCIREDLPSK